MKINFIFFFLNTNFNFNSISIIIKQNLNLWNLIVTSELLSGWFCLVDVCFLLCLILFNDFYFEQLLFDKQNGVLEDGLLKCFKGVIMIIRSKMVDTTKTLKFMSAGVFQNRRN